MFFSIRPTHPGPKRLNTPGGIWSRYRRGNPHLPEPGRRPAGPGAGANDTARQLHCRLPFPMA
jgi:hypothetical protein